MPLNAGADAVVIFNNAGGPPSEMDLTGAPAIPSVMVPMADGLAVMAFIDANPGATAALRADVNILFDDDWYDIMAGFSSRGPSKFELIKPDFVAPGVNILAAVASAGGDPVQYDFYQGTSMSSPHGAGAGALMVALHPSWSPAQIKSALSTSAFNGSPVIDSDGVTPADPFDMGSGRLALAAAGNVGLVLDETAVNFQAADPATGGDPKVLNLPSFKNNACYQTCSWTRTVYNPTDTSMTMVVMIFSL
jgi:subtilisin family serine protease